MTQTAAQLPNTALLWEWAQGRIVATEEDVKANVLALLRAVQITVLPGSPTAAASPPISMICGPTAGCGKTTPFVARGGMLMMPEQCAHCGKPFGAAMSLDGPVSVFHFARSDG
jgi:hypothetical protein